jgi:2-Cys peroxiredoxin 5
MAPIKPGDQMPHACLLENDPEHSIDIADLCKNKKIILCGLPGAFTPCCSCHSLPKYIEKSDELKKKGVDEIICVSVNDPYVMKAWAKDQHAEGKVRLLADTKRELTDRLGLSVDMSDKLGSVRCRRYCALVDNGVVKQLNIEEDPNQATCTLPENIDL